MSAGKFRLRSKAFRNGLIEGFASPFVFFSPRPYLMPDPENNLRDAWDDVSRALEEAYRMERGRVGEIRKTRAASKASERCAATAN
jgi:hypothetical protein